MKYQTTDNAGNSIEIVPGKFMLQRYRSFGQLDDIEVMESSEYILQACAKVYNFSRYRIIRLSNATEINIRRAEYRKS